MRHVPLATTTLLLSLALAPQTSQAAGNVLLPSDSSSANLGFAPQSSSAPEAANSSNPIAPPASPTTPSLLPSSSAPIPAPATPTVPPPQSVGAASGMTPVPTLPTITVSSPVTAAQAAHLKPGTVPTTIIHQSDATDTLSAMGKGLPYSLDISISGKSIFGAKDVKEIGAKLGLSAAKVESACFLTISGMVQTDKGSYLFSGTASPQVIVRYDGTIKSYAIQAQGMCNAKTGDLPPGSGILAEVGDRFRIPLQVITCPAPQRQVTSLSITYDGTKTSQCDYN